MNRYPPLFEELPKQYRASPYKSFGTWITLLLPDLERESIYELFAKGAASANEGYIETLMCPSDSSRMRSGSATSYVANAGHAVSASLQRPANGAFLNRVTDPKAAVLEGHWKDGMDHTLVLSERIDVEPYAILGWNGFKSSFSDDDPVDRRIVDEEKEDRTWGPVFVWHTDPLQCAYINADPCGCYPGDEPPCVPNSSGLYVATTCTIKCNTDKRSPNAKPSSEHNGGVNVAFGSGRALFLRETIDYSVYRALMTLNDKMSDSPNKDFIVDDTVFQ
jgi:hypothetical protein